MDDRSAGLTMSLHVWLKLCRLYCPLPRTVLMSRSIDLCVCGCSSCSCCCSLRLMEVGPPSLVDVTWALVQTLPVNDDIDFELNTMGKR